MYGAFKFVMYGGVLVSLVPFVTDVGALSFAQGLPYSPRELFSFGGLGLVVVGFLGRKFSAPRSDGLS
ncbi:MAG: hypothetical protein V3V08_00750 [Nannocystaceae bacterium]